MRWISCRFMLSSHEIPELEPGNGVTDSSAKFDDPSVLQGSTSF